jgi:phenylpyruvate tautomerase PptA (4-oxalocrotonate tautomerase family)
MPYLQLDVNGHYPVGAKKLLAARMGETYARIMKADVKRITVCIREMGEGAVWRNINDKMVPAALLMCDIRKGRSAETRTELARTLIDICTELLGLEHGRLNVEFTQHSGDEMYHAMLGGLSDDWRADEVG